MLPEAANNASNAEDHLKLRVREGWWDAIKAQAFWDGDVGMLIMDPSNISDAHDNLRYGRVYGQIDGTRRTTHTPYTHTPPHHTHHTATSLLTRTTPSLFLALLVAGTAFVEHVLHIQDLDGNTYYTINDNRWNGEVNECRKKQWFAHKFYTIDIAPDADNFIDGMVFLGIC